MPGTIAQLDERILALAMVTIEEEEGYALQLEYDLVAEGFGPRVLSAPLDMMDLQGGNTHGC